MATLGLMIVLGAGDAISAPKPPPKPKPPTPTAPQGDFAGGTKEQDLSKPPEEKAKAFTAVATELAGNGFVCVEKDGSRIKHTFDANIVVLQGAKPSKTSDILAGDTVTGTRKWVSDTEYTVVRITRFVHKPAPKPEK